MCPDAFPVESAALALDADDPLAGFRERFLHPVNSSGSPTIYFAGNSLGLQPRASRVAVDEVLGSWADRAVEGHFEGARPWYSYPEYFHDSLARLVGAGPDEVVVMNTLTVNLHLLMVSFYRPTPGRHAILMEAPAFPSDTYAVKTQLHYHGFDPREALLLAEPRPGEHILRTEDIERLLEKNGDRIALVLLGGVNFFTGQVLDMARITQAAQRRGCVVGWDLAHAVGNVPLALHDWGADFAVWCSYKYLNAGPGAVAGCFVHGQHGRSAELQRFGGWWGNDPKTRFLMHLQPDFIPREGAGGWQVSNPPILSLAPLRASLDLFDEAGMSALRAKSLRLTGCLMDWIGTLSPHRFEVITPSDEASRGCQLSMLVHERPKELFRALIDEGVVCDFREPNVIRAAPTPLYNSYHDVWRFARILARHDAD
ncbi:MAG: kynureninase [Phycisphaerae bacterium]|nr:kynureninase [Phycisphaerae bacterium]